MTASSSSIPGKVLVTGASGFVGRALCRELKARGFFVRAALRRAGAEQLFVDETVLVGEIDGQTDWTRAVADMDFVVHLAARVHQMNDQASDPWIEYERVNVQGTLSLARAAARARVRRFLFLSSIKVNCEATLPGVATTEQDVAVEHDPYGKSKWIAEQELQALTTQSDLQITVIRPPLVYGPGVQANFLKLIALVERGWPLPLGKVTNARSMIYVGNLVDAIILALVHPNAAGATYLVSDAECFSTSQLVQQLAAAMGKSARFVNVSPSVLRAIGRLLGRAAMIARLTDSLVIDAQRIRRELQWQPPFTASEGFRATCQWYRAAKK